MASAVARFARRKNTLPVDTLHLRPKQKEIFDDESRFKLVNAGRRFGKTYLVRNMIRRVAYTKPRSTQWYIAPTYRQAKRLMWRPLKEVIPKAYIEHKDETDMTLLLKNGSTFSLRGADNPDSLRGEGLDAAYLDEAAFQGDYVWDVLRPMLADKGGTATFISTPCGYNWFYKLVMAMKDRPHWRFWQFTTADGGNVPQEEIDEARSTMDERMFRQEFEASFENLAGRVYYAFDRIQNCSPLIVDDPRLPLLVGMDFNVDPMSAALAVRKGNTLHIFDEISMMNGNTELMAVTLRQRYPERHIIVYPDPTGNAQHTNAAAGQTDFTILRKFKMNVVSPGHAHAMKDKINTTNAALCNASGVRRVMINGSRCLNLTLGLDGLTYVEGTSVPNKKLGIDHMPDAFAYMACMEFPMQPGLQRLFTSGV